MESQVKHILVVEDDKLMRDELSHTLAESGYGVSTAETGEDALSVVEKQRPALILLDVLLPRMDGLEVLRTIRESEAGKEIPVILLSNIKKDDAISSAMELGECDYLPKADWTLEDVLEKVKEKLGS